MLDVAKSKAAVCITSKRSAAAVTSPTVIFLTQYETVGGIVSTVCIAFLYVKYLFAVVLALI